MSEITASVSSFVREVIARFKGDDAQITAEKNERKARSAVKGQIAALEAAIVDEEEKVASAEEAYKEALYPTTVIKDSTVYIKGIKIGKEAVDAAKSRFEEVKDSLKYFNELNKTEFDA